MQGLPVFDPQAPTMIDLESFVHHEHFLRKVDRETAVFRRGKSIQRIPRSPIVFTRRANDVVSPAKYWRRSRW